MDENKILKRNTLRTLLLFAFALSGLTCFIYEVVWIRPLQLIFGSTIYAVSTMLTTFMVGFVLGAFLFRNLADRSKNPAILFAGLEFGIGLYGLVILSLFKILPPIYLSLLGVSGFQFLQFGLAFLVLILPATLFGATWPVVNKALLI
jgi:spermidine synthase